ncbi:hypothetical protein P9112_012072 [Eukaryota sp. TZLM1-RC]
MLKRFKLTFGSPEDVVIGYGDWSSNGNTRKGKGTTTRGTEIRKLLRRFGYRIFLVDEYRTSKSCSSCAAKGNFGECVNDSSIKVLGPKGKRQLKRKAKKLKQEIDLFNQNNPTRKRDFQQEWREQKDSLEPSIFERPKTQTKEFENGSSTSQRDQKKKTAEKDKKPRRCGLCRGEDHNRRNCPSQVPETSTSSSGAKGRQGGTKKRVVKKISVEENISPS